MKSIMYKEKLVAYALGELSESEAAEIAAIVAKDADALKFVEEVRAFSRLAAQDLGAEPLPIGGGSLPILKKIVAHQERSKMSNRQVWAQAAVLGLLVVLFFAAFPLRKKFGGNVAQLIGGRGAGTSESTSTAIDDGAPQAPVKRTMRENPTLIDRDFAELGDRTETRWKVQRCHFSLPAKLVTDKIQPDSKAVTLSAVYFLAETSSELKVNISTAIQPMVRELDLEELEHDERYTMYRRKVSDTELAYYKVSAKAHLPICVVKIELEGNLSEEARKRAGGNLGGFAATLLQSLEAQ